MWGELKHIPPQYLPRNTDTFGIPLRLDPPLPTRWEEFLWVKKHISHYFLQGDKLLDAACGFEPGVHIFPEIAQRMGYDVTAIDLKDEIEGAFGQPFPDLYRLKRKKGDITDLSEYPSNWFDVYVCISALEHMNQDVQKAALREAVRVLRITGMMVLTLDTPDDALPWRIQSWLPEINFGPQFFEAGKSLEPRVVGMVGIKNV